MATLTTAGRIDDATVEEEIERLRRPWRRPESDGADAVLETLPGEHLAGVDPFDRPQLAAVVAACRSNDAQRCGPRAFRGVPPAEDR